jgi:hypothetical protein
MPKIPVFTAQARPTEEVGSVINNIQVSPSESVGAALIKPAAQIAEYYAKEKDISNKVKAGELYGDATVEIFNASQAASLKKTPEDGVSYFQQQFKIIKDKYKNQAINSDVGNIFDVQFSANKSTYINSILKTTRDTLVSTRIGQVDQQVKSKIATALSGNNFQFKVLSGDIVNLYKGLVDDKLIREEDLNVYKKALPKLIETEMVKKMAVTNANGAIVALQNDNNFKTIQGEERDKLRSELRTIAKFQDDQIKFVTGKMALESKKKTAKALMGDDNKIYGINPNDLNQYFTGNKEIDIQIEILNNKVLNKEISLDTDYITNDKVINKILNGEINTSYDKFILPGESEKKSITERIGDGSINLNDDNFFTNIIENNLNPQLKESNKSFFNFINKVSTMIKGTPSAQVFDENYNSRLSLFRQDMYKNFHDGLKNNIPESELLNPRSENYIAKNILSYAPSKSELRSALLDYVKKKEYTPSSDEPKKQENESHSEWLTRWKKWKASSKK